jgi:hypothetical protein
MPLTLWWRQEIMETYCPYNSYCEPQYMPP